MNTLMQSAILFHYHSEKKYRNKRLHIVFNAISSLTGVVACILLTLAVTTQHRPSVFCMGRTSVQICT